MSYAARIEREYELRAAALWEAHEAGEHAEPVRDCVRCIHASGVTVRYGERDRDQEPDPEWTEDAEGYVRAPLSYENREGDPAFNGAFDKW